jgi:hypothetical protein
MLTENNNNYDINYDSTLCKYFKTKYLDQLKWPYNLFHFCDLKKQE